MRIQNKQLRKYIYFPDPDEILARCDHETEEVPSNSDQLQQLRFNALVLCSIGDLFPLLADNPRTPFYQAHWLFHSSINLASAETKEEEEEGLNTTEDVDKFLTFPDEIKSV